MTVICGCTVTQPLRARDTAWAAALILKPGHGTEPGRDAARECLESSLRTSYAFVDFKDSRISDAQVEQALHWKAISLPALARMRRSEGYVWRQTHDAAKVAAYDLSTCMQAFAGIRLRADPRWGQCLYQTEPAALISIYRHTGRPLPAAVDEVVSHYGTWEPTSAARSLAQRIYLAPTQVIDFRIREQLLSHCLATAER